MGRKGRLVFLLALLLATGLALVLFAACGSTVQPPTPTVNKEYWTLDENNIHRFVDSAQGNVCYIYRNTGAISCVPLDSAR